MKCAASLRELAVLHNKLSLLYFPVHADFNPLEFTKGKEDGIKSGVSLFPHRRIAVLVQREGVQRPTLGLISLTLNNPHSGLPNQP